MKLSLPRIYNHGPPPIMVINSNVRNILDLRNYSYSENIPKTILTELYINRKLSQQKIANVFNVQHDTIRRWLDRLDIPVRSQGDSVSLAISRYHKSPFSGDLSEKAYMLGLRYGDISAQRHGRSIRVQTGSTHPALLELFESVFSRYGKINKYPKISKNNKLYEWEYSWCIYSDVNKSFDFMLDKPKRIPEWIIENDKLFYSFLSGYFDAEGCIFIDYVKGNGSKLVWTVRSTDKHTLEDIHNFLIKAGFSAKFRLAKEADGIEYNKDYWSITVCTKNQVLDILRSMKLKHSEKIMKHKLALDLINTNWKNASEKIVELRNKIKNEVRECVESAEKCYMKQHS